LEQETWRYTLDIDPMPAPRPRARAIRAKNGKHIASVYNPSEYTHWIADAHEQLINQIGHDTLAGDLTLGLVITVQKPKTSKLTRPKPDADNYAKAVMDAMTKAGIWHDDSQVAFLAVKKQWGGIGRIDIEVTRGVAGE